MKKRIRYTLSIVACLGLLFSAPVSFASHPDCKELATRAAKALNYVINDDNRPTMEVTEKSDSTSAQIFEVNFSEEGSAYLVYTVTVDRNASGIEANQWCDRVSKIEITGEE